jgi:molybdenum cofactor cytidylyltransferase
MPRSPSFAALILAAGESSRMGTDKALLPWPPMTPGKLASSQASPDSFLSAAIRSLGLTCDFVLVVAGKNESALRPVVFASGADLVVNPDPSRGQFSSLQVGLDEVLNRGRDTAVITLVDRPPAQAATLDLLQSAFVSAPTDIWSVVPEFSGKHGHPFIAARELIEAFLRAPTAGSARDVEHSLQQHIQYIAVSDPSVALNINTPEEYAALATSRSH